MRRVISQAATLPRVRERSVVMINLQLKGGARPKSCSNNFRSCCKT